jgi:hypothetical protein
MPAPVKEVTAWAVVDKDGDYGTIDDLFNSEEDARDACKRWNQNCVHLSPHRVIRVRIVPDEEQPAT